MQSIRKGIILILLFYCLPVNAFYPPIQTIHNHIREGNPFSGTYSYNSDTREFSIRDTTTVTQKDGNRGLYYFANVQGWDVNSFSMDYTVDVISGSCRFGFAYFDFNGNQTGFEFQTITADQTGTWTRDNSTGGYDTYDLIGISVTFANSVQNNCDFTINRIYDDQGNDYFLPLSSEGNNQTQSMEYIPVLALLFVCSFAIVFLLWIRK